MSSLKARLSKAKARLFGTATKDIAVPFDLPCECGHRVSGVRRASWQVATCTGCEAKVYVLPVNVYPATKRIRSEVLDGSVVNRLGVIVKDLVAGDSESASDPAALSDVCSMPPASFPSPRSPIDDQESSGRGLVNSTDTSTKRSRRSDPRRNKVNAAAAALAADPILIEEPVVQVQRIDITVKMRRILTPFRMLMLSAAVLITATGWWVVTQRRFEDARKTWRREMDAAEEALERRDVSLLKDSLGKAIDASKILQRNDAEARRADSLYLQTKALQELGSTDIVSILAGCLSPDRRPDAEKAVAAAEVLKGKWFVFDAMVVNSGDELHVDLPFMIDSVPVKTVFRSEKIKQAITALPQSPLLFVAAVNDCEVVDGGREFRIELDGTTCTLVTTEFHASEMGFSPDNTPGLADLIRQQSEFVKSNAATIEREQQR